MSISVEIPALFSYNENMKSIQTKFLVLILSSVLLCAAVIGVVSIKSATKVIDNDSAMSMNLMCKERGAMLDSLLVRMEQSVETLAVYSMSELESPDRLINDQAYLDNYKEHLYDISANAAQNTEGALAVYLHFNPDIMPPDEGFFMNKKFDSDEMVKTKPMDLSLYSPDDIQMKWYYAPVAAKKALWLEPYYNPILKCNIISYIIPLYKGVQLIGILGMDIDFSVIEELTDAADIYDTGYAFLTDDSGNLIYHPYIKPDEKLSGIVVDTETAIVDFDSESSDGKLYPYSWNGQKKKMAFTTLRNGMKLAIAAPIAEIDASTRTLFSMILAITVIIALIFGCLTFFITEKLVSPLKALTSAAQKIADGNLDVSLTRTTNDEIGILTESFQTTVASLNNHIEYINNLAYLDALTGVKNKTAYYEAVSEINKNIQLGHARFAVAIFDINNLKIINDTFGHETGDYLITKACGCLCSIFKLSPVYRIGGDEFVIILEGDDYDEYAKSNKCPNVKMTEQLSKESGEMEISIACGIAVYIDGTDKNYGDVFRRADQAMYTNKTLMKEADPSPLEEAFL